MFSKQADNDVDSIIFKQLIQNNGKLLVMQLQDLSVGKRS